MKTVAYILAEKLLEISAIKLQPANPFVWASGWNSPIYTDNRKTLSYPSLRSFIKIEIARTVAENFKDVDAIAGVATGAIAQGALVADILGLPYVYVRSSPKDHGLENLIEGNLKAGQKVVVIEDLISTGGSCIEVVDALREAGADVLGVVSIFTYGMEKGKQRLKEADVLNYSLTNFDTLCKAAVEEGYITDNEELKLKTFMSNPSDPSWQSI